MPIAAALDPLFNAAGQTYDVDPNLLRAVALQESGANPATPNSPAGAEGIMQFLPATAREMGVANPYDPAQAIPGAARYLAQGLAEGERLKANGAAVDPAAYAVMYYHGGPDTAQWGPRTQAYVQSVAARYRGLPAAGPGSGGAAGVPQRIGANPPREDMILPSVPDAGVGLSPDLASLAQLGQGLLPPDIAALAARSPTQLAGAGIGDYTPQPRSLAPGGALVRSDALPSDTALPVLPPDLRALSLAGTPPAAPTRAPTAAAPPAAGAAPPPVSAGEGSGAPDESLSPADQARLLAFARGDTQLLPEPGAQAPGAAPVASPIAGAPQLPPLPAGATADFDPLELQRAIYRNQIAGLPTGAQEKDMDLFNRGFMRYRLPNGQAVDLPYPGGPADPAFIARQKQAEAGGTAAGGALYDLVPVTVRMPDGTVVERQMSKAQALALSAGVPGGTAGGGGAGGGAAGAVGAPGAGTRVGGMELGGKPVAPLGYEKAVERIDNLTTQANAAQNDLATITSLQDIMGRGLSTGWGADARLEAGRALAALGISEDDVKNLTGVSPSDAQEFNKQALRLSAQAVRAMGAREPGSVISLFGRAYPSIETQPQAIQFISNVLAQEAQRIQDQRAFMVGRFNAPSGNSYGAVAQAEADFAKQNPATAYLHAAEAMTKGYQAQAWGGASPTEQQRIFGLIPPGRAYYDPSGNQRHRGGAATP